MRYEWDEEKNRLNQKKHRISFEMAALAFEDECCLVRPDRVDEPESNDGTRLGRLD